MPHVTIPNDPTEVIFAVTSSSSGPFAFNFSYFATADIRVAFNGIEIDSGSFTVAPTVTAENGFEGGEVTLTTPVAAGSLRVWRDVPIARTTDFPTAGPFSVSALNTWLDKVFAILQQITTGISRSLRMSDSEGSTLNALPGKSERANKALMFDADGQPIAGPTSSDISGAQGYAATASASAAAAAASAATATTVAGKIPNPTVPADNGKFLRVKTDGSGNYEVTTVSASGDVVGPASGLDRGIPLFSGTSGKLLKSGPALGTSGHALVSGGAGADPAFGQITSAGIADSAVILAKLDRTGTAGQILYSNGAAAPSWGAAPAAGEANSGTNVGSGSTIFKDKSALNLRFRSLIAVKSGTKPAPGVGGTVVMTDLTFTATQNADDVTFTITPTWTEIGGGGGS